jgi:hypothetical protein
LFGVNRSSASRNAKTSPDASRTAWFRAAPLPAFSCLTTITGLPNRRATSPLPSVDPSSTTMISSGLRVWTSALSIASPRYGAAL